MKYWFAICIWFFVSSIFAQEEDRRIEKSHPFYRHYGILDGLPSNEAYFVYQDKDGYIWICTDNGVSRFDGVEFKNYSENEGLCSNVIFGCKEDDSGTLWLYSYTGELTRYNSIRDRFECPDFNSTLSENLHGKIILDLVFDKDTIYVVTEHKYIKITGFNTQKTEFAFFPVTASENTLEATILNSNQSLVLNSIRNKRGNFDLVIKGKIQDTIKGIKFEGKISPSLTSKVHGELFIFFGENLFIYDFKSKTHTVTKLPFNHTPSLKVSSDGLWSGSFNNGLWHIQKTSDGLKKQQFLDEKNISSSMIDQLGGIWASSQTDGLYYIPSHIAFNFSGKTTDYTGKTNSIFIHNKKAYYLTYSGNLYGIENNTNPYQIKLAELNSQSPVLKGVIKDELLIQANTSIAFNLIKNTTREPDAIELVCLSEMIDKLPTFTIRADTFVMLSCENGRAKSEIVSTRWKYGRVISKARTKNNLIWMGTIYDLFVYDESKKSLSSIAAKNKLPRLYCRHILPLAMDTTMIATSQGIFLIAKDKIVKRITTVDGLSSDKVFYLLKEKNRVWAATSKGLDLIENIGQATKPKIKFVNGLAGMPLCQITQLADFDKYILAGTSLGAFLLDKSLIEKSDIEIKTYVKQIVINDSTKIFPVPENLILDYYQNSITIQFVSFNYRNALFNKYRYRLKSSDEAGWLYTNQNQIYFPQLFPGNYSFEIQAMNPDGNWSEYKTTIAFKIKKPFWQTWWFFGIIILGLLILTYVIFKARLKQVKQLSRLNEKLLEAKIQALGMQLNPHFVFNALNSVSYHMAHNDAKTTLKFLGKLGQLMRFIFKNSQSAIIPLEQELKAVRLYIELETVRLGKTINYTIELEDNIDPQVCKIPALLLQPIVENAIWHGIGPMEKEGKLWIIFRRNSDTLQIEIIDNGIGVKEAQRIKSSKKKERHSLDVINERLSLLQMQFKSHVYMEIKDRFEKDTVCGTKVLIVIPWLNENAVVS